MTRSGNRRSIGFPEGYNFTVLDQAGLHRAARGLTPIHNATLGDVSITGSSATPRPAFTPFNPSFVLDREGMLWSQLELAISATSAATVGFGRNAAPTYHEAGMATVGSVKRQDVYATSGGVKGVAVAAAQIYGGSAELGILRLYLVRNASNELSYLFDYAPSGLPGVGTYHLTIAAENLTLSYLYLPLP